MFQPWALPVGAGITMPGMEGEAIRTRRVSQGVTSLESLGIPRQVPNRLFQGHVARCQVERRGQWWLASLGREGTHLMERSALRGPSEAASDAHRDPAADAGLPGWALTRCHEAGCPP